jgi:hypothetical protein
MGVAGTKVGTWFASLAASCCGAWRGRLYTLGTATLG